MAENRTLREACAAAEEAAWAEAVAASTLNSTLTFTDLCPAVDVFFKYVHNDNYNA
jgi:hypothetical protein